MNFVYDNKTGEEKDILEYAKRLNFTIPRGFTFTSIQDMMNSEQRIGEEGYVIHFEDGNRLKWKFEDYCRLHSVITRSTNHHVWEYLKNDNIEELYSIIPDEFYPQLHKVIAILEKEYNDLFIKLYSMYCDIIKDSLYNGSKKSFALIIQGMNKCKSLREYSGFMFSAFDNNIFKMNEIIWHKIYPENKNLLEF